MSGESGMFIILFHYNTIKLPGINKYISMVNIGMPGVFFSYEISPIMIKYSEHAKSFAHFATGLFAIVGGIFTVAGIIDSTIYKSANVLKKLEIGKQG